MDRESGGSRRPAGTVRAGATERGGDAELKARIAELERRLEQMGPRGGTSAAAVAWLDRVVPPHVRNHFREGSREQLLGVRALLDHWIGRLGAERPGDGAPGQHETIRIE